MTFGAYRVFGCAGSTLADIMIVAMERALADGMQVAFFPVLCGPSPPRSHPPNVITTGA